MTTTITNVQQRSDVAIQSIQQRSDAIIQDLRTQISQIATLMNEQKMQNSSILPYQTIINLKDNVSSITLKSGKCVKTIPSPSFKPSNS